MTPSYRSSSLLFCSIVALLLGLGCSEDSTERIDDVRAPDAAADSADSGDIAATGDIGDSAEADAGLTCEDRQSAYFEMWQSLPKGCSVDTDCTIEPMLARCGDDCPGDGADAVATSADLAPLRALGASFDEEACTHPLTCMNNYQCDGQFLHWTDSYRAVCVAGNCKAVADPACDDFADFMTLQSVERDARTTYKALKGDALSPFACTEAADCELRDDVSRCGCDVAVAVGADTSLPAYAEAIVDQAESCGVTCDECPTVSGVDCVNNRCQTTP